MYFDEHTLPSFLSFLKLSSSSLCRVRLNIRKYKQKNLKNVRNVVLAYYTPPPHPFNKKHNTEMRKVCGNSQIFGKGFIFFGGGGGCIVISQTEDKYISTFTHPGRLYSV